MEPLITVRRVDAALAMCRMLHRGQTDKGGFPYHYHPIRVQQRLQALVPTPRVQEDLEIAAQLHDTVEDTVADDGDIQRFFGARVQRLVMAVTRIPSVTYVEFIESLADTGTARLIKVADLLDNLDPKRAGPHVPESLHKRHRDALVYLTDVARQAGDLRVDRLLEREALAA